MFDITGDHVSLLNDADLRSLIGLLCEAEARRGGVSPLGVTWGGDQNAADGGVDVRAALQGQMGPQSNLPRSLTGFQVKAQNATCRHPHRNETQGNCQARYPGTRRCFWRLHHCQFERIGFRHCTPSSSSGDDRGSS
jgi:hypothetical protein